MAEKKTSKPEAAAGVTFDGDPRIGSYVGAGVFALLGVLYGSLGEINDLTIGPVPGQAVGLAFGAAFGFWLGGMVGAAGREMLTPRAAAGFAIGFGVMLMGRLADSSGHAIDKTMDILVGGAFWGTFGALLGAVNLARIAEADGESGGDASAVPAKPKPKPAAGSAAASPSDN